MQMQQLKFTKMSGVGNDFIIFDARHQEVKLSAAQIRKISNRKAIGCDQLIIIKNSSRNDHLADCFMEIYNSDGSTSGACGNATRCVASIVMDEKKSDQIVIETVKGLLACKKAGDEISVEMGVPVFENNFYFNDMPFICVNMGNPHAVTFVDEIPVDDVFFEMGQEIAAHKFFPEGTNVEFAKIISDSLIEVRVYERGAGETLACGSGACAVAVAAIKNNLIKGNKVITRFKGGDLTIEWNAAQSAVIMTGGYGKIFDGVIDKSFC